MLKVPTKLFIINHLIVPAYSTRFRRKNDDVSVLRSFVRWFVVVLPPLASLRSVASLSAVDRLRLNLNLIDGGRA